MYHVGIIKGSSALKIRRSQAPDRMWVNADGLAQIENHLGLVFVEKAPQLVEGSRHQMTRPGMAGQEITIVVL